MAEDTRRKHVSARMACGNNMRDQFHRDMDALSVGSYHGNHHGNQIHPAKLQIMNDLRAFQCSGIMMHLMVESEP